MLRRVFPALLALGALASACSISDLPYRCDKDSECVYKGETGTCELSGYCSFGDENCDSHRRYGSQAPDAYAGKCVPRCVQKLALGGQHSCALRWDGRLFCWGNATDGELGNGVTSLAASGDPIEVTAVGLASDVAAGTTHTCAINAESGNVWCWGKNDAFQIGAKKQQEAGPVEIVPLLHAKDKPSTHVAAGVAHSCALGSYGVECWGSNGQAQLAKPDTVPGTWVPTNVLPAAQEIEAGGVHSCARLATGKVTCWGSNATGQIDPATAAQGAKVSTPLDTGRRASALALGIGHTCVVFDGKVSCWGNDQTGQLGKPGAGLGPLEVSLPRDATDVCAGAVHSCALLSDGSAMCWGNDEFGELGPSIDPVSVTTPVKVALARPIVELRCGGKHTCARTDDDRIWCWGDDELGELGNGTTGATGPNPTPDSSVTAKLCR